MQENLARQKMEKVWQNSEYLAGFYSFLIQNPKFSFWDSIQILSINPKAKICKTFNAWHDENNRRINKGESAIPYYDEKTLTKKYVFDISQTYGSEVIKENIKIAKTDLLDFFCSQTLFRTNDNEPLSNIIYEYCQDHLEQQFDYDDEYLKCLSEGVTQCINELIGEKNNLKLSSLLFDFETNTRLCEEVYEVSNNLIKQYNETERKKENVKNERERNRRIKKSRDNQLTLFDFKEELSEGELSRLLPNDVVTEQNNQSFGNNASRNQDTTNGIRKEIISTKPELSEELRNYGDEENINREIYTGRNNLSPSQNYRLSDKNFIYESGLKTRFKINIEAIKLLKNIEKDNRQANDNEKEILVKYLGWGGIPQAFDNELESWKNEYKELLELLTTEEYIKAKESVLSAHYTNKDIIDNIYKALAKMGLSKGRILEPSMGTGNFIGLLPDTFNASQTYGVELDSISGRIAKLLYPQTHIEVKGFEETNYKNNSFDAIITNVPFGAFKVYDRDYDKLGFYIHNYFIAKSLDKVRAGGILAVITSKGTLDKEGSDVRKYIGERAKLVGAIRLPNNAFQDSANTKVTSDILFFQKREKYLEKIDDDWINLGITKEGFEINNYFINNPQMMLGNLVKEMGMYGANELTLNPDDRSLKEALENAISYLPTNIYNESNAIKDTSKVSEEIIPADKNIKNYCYEIFNETLYQRIDDEMVAQDISSANFERMEMMIKLRKQVRHLLDIQLDNCSDDELVKEQTKLNFSYDTFVKKYGIINSRLNRSLFRDDSDFALLISVENVDTITGTATKTDIFSKRTIIPVKEIKSCDNALEALKICKSEKGIVDIHYIEQLTNKSYSEIIEELGDNIYQEPDLFNDNNPYVNWLTASEYLSGDVKEKLRIAKLSSISNIKYHRNTLALLKIQPKPLEASEIAVRIGATWVEPEIYKDFIIELLNVRNYYSNYINVKYEPFTGEWRVERNSTFKYDVNANSIYGTNRLDAYKIFESCLNMQTPTIYDTIEEDGKKKQIVNRAETVAVREKQKKIQNKFKEWIFDDVNRRNRLVDKYNEIFNNLVLQKYDGSYLTFKGMNPLIILKDYQKDAVDRIITSGNTLLHHVVGAGKTFEMAAAVMKMKQLGIVRKAMIVVPNHLVVQWANEFRLLYPNANLLIATKKDFEKINRMKFVARVATGDWDAVIIAGSSFEKIPISKERQEQKIQDEISAVEATIVSAKHDRSDRVTVKTLERVLKNKKETLKKLLDDTKKDDLLKFEDLGIDCLCIDEAHRYKNKFIFTKMNNVAGISKAMSQRATDLDMKCQYINEVRGDNKGIIFATGTPISNSMVEMFTLQSYLQREELAKKGMSYFDGWAANFGETITALELSPSGQGYRTRTRFAKFTNLPELLKMYYSFADVKTADMLNLPVPKAIKQTIIAKPSEEILSLNEEIVKRADKIYNKQVTPEEDNMLCVTHDGKMIALDPRCFDSNLPDNFDNKVNLCMQKVHEIWNETKERRSTQIIFCDMSTPKINFDDYDSTTAFDVYNDIKNKLVNHGIPKDEIAFIHDANTDLQKQELFEKIRQGIVRVLIGSTEKCGAGTNIQSKLKALHHLDTPYRPSDLEQREGRIVRQGNSNDEVNIFTYVTERTFDSYSYQILENKQKFISQINRGDMSVREAEDIDETTLSYSEIKAITSANPKIKRKMEIELELNRLKTLEFQHRQNRYSLQNKLQYIPNQIINKETRIESTQKDIKLREIHKNDFIAIAGHIYEERKDAGDTLIELVKSEKYVDQIVGKINGFNIIPMKKDIFGTYSVKLIGNIEHECQTSDSGQGTIIRIENCLNSFESNINRLKIEIDNSHKELEIIKEEVNQTFEYKIQLEELSDELASIDAELDLGREETPIVLEKEDITDASIVNQEENYDTATCF